MERGDGDRAADDGIVAEDVTQLVEHIELTGAGPLPDAPAWELVTPVADLDEAPVRIAEMPGETALDETTEDPEQFTETHADLGQLLPPGERAADRGAALAAERARWQRRVEELQRALAERDQLLAERERRIEELSARLATRTLESESLAAELRDVQPLEAPAPPALAPARPHVAPRLRRYLIGLDLVGCVHEVATRRISIGRTRDNDLRIVDPTVSRLHAMLTIRGGVAMLVDANSRNGIFVNGIQVRYAKLDDGDLVTFGTVRFRYRIGSGAADAFVGSA